MRVSPNQGYLFGGPQNKDYCILGSILGSPNFGKLPYASSFIPVLVALHSRYLSCAIVFVSGPQDTPRKMQTSIWTFSHLILRTLGLGFTGSGRQHP